MSSNKHESDIMDRKFGKSLTHLISIIGRKGPLSLIKIKEEMRKENPEHGGRYVEVILSELTPKDSRILAKRLFCWNDLLSNPEQTKENLKKKLEPDNGKDTVVQHELQNSSDDQNRHARIQVNRNGNWLRIEIDFKIVIKESKDISQTNEMIKEERYVFDDLEFKATQSIDGKESLVNHSFSQKRKNGKLYVYANHDSNPNLRTYLNKTLDKSRTSSIIRYVTDKVVLYLLQNKEIIRNNIENRKIRISPESEMRYQEIFGKAFPIIDAILRAPIPVETDHERIKQVIQSVTSHISNQEIPNLNQGYWLYSLNIRGFMKYFVLIESQNKISKVISAICNDHSYNYINNKIINIKDLEFPFLIYHNEIMSVLPEKFTAFELTQIGKRLEGLIDYVSLNELIFLVTYEYLRDFEHLMKSNPTGIHKETFLEKIKSSDEYLYTVIMDYAIKLLDYIESFQQKRLSDTRGKLTLLKEVQREEKLECEVK